MEGQNSQVYETTFDPVSKISQIASDKDRKIMETEAYVKYSKLEIIKLEEAIKTFNEKTRKLDSETESFQKQIKQLDDSIDISRQSLEVKSKIYINLKQEVDRLEDEAKELTKRNDKIYNEYVEKYKKARNVYETYHPLYNEVKQLQIENLKCEVRFKMLRAQVTEKKNQMKQRRDIHNKIRNATIVQFAKNSLEYWKSKHLTHQLIEAKKQEANLNEQLRNLEILATQKGKELQQKKRIPVSSEASQIKNMEFTMNQHCIEFSTNDDNNFVTAPSLSAYSSKFNPLVADSRSQSEEMLLKIRTRCEQRKREWIKQRSISSIKKQTLHPLKKAPQMNILAQGNIPTQKRPLQPTHLPNHSSQFKVPKTVPDRNVGKENIPSINQQAHPLSTSIENSVFTVQNPKANIISVHTIKSNKSSIPTNQYLYEKQQSLLSQDLKKNYSQVISQSRATPLQNYASQNIISQIQSQETKNNMVSPKQQFQSYVLEDTNKNSQAPLGSIDGVTQNPSEYISQTSLQYHPKNLASQSQVDNSQQLPQEVSQIKPSFIDSYLITQPNMNQIQTNLTQESNKSGNNTLGTSQSSTFSQKYMEYQHFLQQEQKAYMPSSIAQNTAIAPVLTSPFFNNPEPGGTTKIATEQHEVINRQEPLSGHEIDSNFQYLDSSMLTFSEDGDANMYTYEGLLSPEGYEHNSPAGELQSEPTNFFLQPQTTQTTERKFTFSANTATSNPFSNMF